MVFEAYMCSRLMEMVLECFLHLIKALDARKYEEGMKILERVCVCVLGVVSAEERKRE